MRETLETLSKTTYRNQFRLDFEQLSESVQPAVADAIEALATRYLTKPWNHPDARYVPSQGEIWRLKIKQDAADHRVFFDVTDDGLVFLAVKHRDTAYD